MREWRDIQQGPRVIVHLASWSLDHADQRMTVDNFRVRQNSQLSRLCDLVRVAAWVRVRVHPNPDPNPNPNPTLTLGEGAMLPSS